MVFSLGLGKKKTKTTKEEERDFQQATTGTTTSQQQQQQQQAQQQTGTTATQARGTQETAATTATGRTGTTTATGQQRQTIDRLSQEARSGLESLFLSGLSGSTGLPNLQSLSDLALGQADFDEEAFVEGRVQTATQNFEDTILPQLSQLQANLGGSAATNSAANILQQQVARQRGATISGAESEAIGAAEAIQRANLETAAGIAGGEVNALTAIGSLLTQAQQVAAGETAQEEVSAQEEVARNRASTVTGSETQSQTEQTLLSILENILAASGTTAQQTTGSEQVSGTQRGKSGGFSLGLSLGGDS